MVDCKHFHAHRPENKWDRGVVIFLKYYLTVSSIPLPPIPNTDFIFIISSSTWHQIAVCCIYQPKDFLPILHYHGRFETSTMKSQESCFVRIPTCPSYIGRIFRQTLRQHIWPPCFWEFEGLYSCFSMLRSELDSKGSSLPLVIYDNWKYPLCWRYSISTAPYVFRSYSSSSHLDGSDESSNSLNSTENWTLIEL